MQNKPTRSSSKPRSRSPLTTLVLALAAAPVLAAAPEPLIEAHSVTIDHSLAPQQAAAQMLAARRYDTFWDNGDEHLARSALAPDFIDATLPPGRPQGVAGPLAASHNFRAAVPDLRCEVEQMIVAGDRVVSHLRFTGHFSGQLNGVQGRGQRVDFIATDIYQVTDGRITKNWHIEDNLTFLQQIGMVAR